MSDAHRGSMMGQSMKYAAIAADRDCTFLAHYNLNLEDVVRGFTPNDGTQAIVSRRGGKFGGFAAVLSNATELCSDGNLASSSGVAGFSPIDGTKLTATRVDWPTSDCPNEFGRVIRVETTAAASSDVGHSYGISRFITVGANSANRTFCLGTWVLGPAGETGYIRQQSYDYTAGNDGSVGFTFTGDWQFIPLVKTFSSTAAANSIQLRLSITSNKVGVVAYWTDVSFKELPYPTVFGTTAGTSDASTALSYPLSDLIPNRSSWTMSGWFKPVKTAAQGGHAIVFNMGRYTNPSTEDYLWFGWDNNSNNLRFISVRWNGASATTIDRTINGYPRISDFRHLALSFDWTAKLYRIYVDGNLIITVDASTFPSAPEYLNSVVQVFNERLFIGHYDRSNANILASEVRFDQRVVDDDEIKAWASMVGPFYPRGIQRALS